MEKKRLNYAATNRYRVMVSTEIIEERFISAYTPEDAVKGVMEKLNGRNSINKKSPDPNWSWGEVDVLLVESI